MNEGSIDKSCIPVMVVDCILICPGMLPNAKSRFDAERSWNALWNRKAISECGFLT
jgi:hypothetical protein